MTIRPYLRTAAEVAADDAAARKALDAALSSLDVMCRELLGTTRESREAAREAAAKLAPLSPTNTIGDAMSADPSLGDALARAGVEVVR